MRFRFICSTALVLFAAQAASAGGSTFSYTAPGGAINDASVQFFPLTFGTPNELIADVELEITNLTHSSPGDLNVFLLDPFGNSLEVFDDKGNGFLIENQDFVFNDIAASELPPSTQLVGDTYLPDQATAGAGFAQFTNGGVDAWILVVIDDAATGGGSFESFTIRGTVVPEPVTLSLLGLGAVAVLRRKRKTTATRL
ncbi:MAG: PEP-CTERM sorting domain-containing protein [Phycisphaerae bacterium]